MKSLYFFVFLFSISLIADVDAGWKFWKKKKDDNSTATEPTLISNPEPVVTPGPTTKAPTTKAPTTKAPAPVNTNKALAGAADPGLAIGVGTSGGNIRDNARPQRPNPGTEVGLDLPKPKPSNGYRDWAIDLTGASEGRQPPKVPSQGPAVSPGQQPRPGSPVPGSPSQLPASGTPKPGTPPPSPKLGTSQQVPSAGPGSLGYPSQPQKPGTPGQQTPSSGPGSLGSPSQTPRPGTLGQPTPSPGPGSLGYPSQPSKPASPTNPGSQQNFPKLPSPSSGSGSLGTSSSGSQSPTGGKTFAEIAAGGSRPSSPTPGPKQGHPNSSLGQTGQVQPGGTQPTAQPGKAGIPAGTLAAGAVAGAAAGAATTGQQFSANPTFSKGNTVTNEDLEKLSEALFIKDTNNAMKHITLNLQKQTSGNSPVDEAPQPLLNVKPEALQIPTIQKVLAIYDNYQLDSRTNEYISPAQRQEESLLVDTFLSTNLMSYAMRFLSDKGLVRKDYYEYKDLLRRMWFNLFSRGEGKIGSSGFEHVFMTELKLGTEVSGLHNWIYFNAEELKRRADYLGYIRKVDLGDKAAIVKVHAKFNGFDKPVTTMFIGTSPELEMSLYTVCFLARPDQSCPVSLGGTKFNIVTHKFRYRGKDLVGSAYPEI